MKRVAVVGSTGSIGENALEVIGAHPDRFRVAALAVYSNIDRLESQIRRFEPAVVSVYDSKKALELSRRLGRRKVSVLSGAEGLKEIARSPNVDFFLCGAVGAQGLEPIVSAIRAGKDVGIANKEPLVMAGAYVMGLARKKKVRVLPIDSEHSAIWQCLQGANGHAASEVRKIILTASGGPFVGRKRAELSRVTPSEAVRHPRWQMGKKISVDSATLMNKGLEVHEAHHLFNVPIDCIDVLVHREAVIHSMVEFVDGSYMAQMAINDMKIPIQYALSYPKRLPLRLPPLDLVRIRSLTFEAPDRKVFPCLDMAYQACRDMGTAPAVLNAANEVAVDRFLKGAVPFLGIPKIIERVMERHRLLSDPTLDQICQADEWAREKACCL